MKPVDPDGYRWVRRNEDKPHRCPNCHAIPDRAWANKGYGRRTVLTHCGLKWRVKHHSRRLPMRWKHVRGMRLTSSR